MAEWTEALAAEIRRDIRAERDAEIRQHIYGMLSETNLIMTYSGPKPESELTREQRGYHRFGADLLAWIGDTDAV